MNNTLQNNNRIELVNMEFYSHHGHFNEEKIIGNKFIVNFSAGTDVVTPGKTDNLEDALNYQDLYMLISEEMCIQSNLLENVAYRILERVKKTYPNVIWAQVSISKLNPPVGGKVEASRVVMSY